MECVFIAQTVNLYQDYVSNSQEFSRTNQKLEMYINLK